MTDTSNAEDQQELVILSRQGRRKVATPEGSAFYGLPVGATITADVASALDASASKMGIKPPAGGLTGGGSSTGGASSGGASSGGASSGGAPSSPSRLGLRVTQPTISGPHKFSVGSAKYTAPSGSTLYEGATGPNIAYVVLPDGNVHAFSEDGEAKLSPQDATQLKLLMIQTRLHEGEFETDEEPETGKAPAEDLLSIDPNKDSTPKLRQSIADSIPEKTAAEPAKQKDGTVRVTPTTGSPEDFADSRMSHQAPTNNGEDAPIFAMDRMYPDNIYDANAAKIYGSGYPELDKEAIKVIHSVKGDPDALVTVYRTINAEDSGKQPEAALRPGDWVTPTLGYAQIHARNDRSSITISAEVPAKHLYTEGNSLLEWGYDPTPDEDAEPEKTAEVAPKAEEDEKATEEALTAAAKQADADLAKAKKEAEAKKTKELLDQARAYIEMETLPQPERVPDSLGESFEISPQDADDLLTSPYSSEHLNPDGTFTEERKALHDKIVASFVDGVKLSKNPVQYMNGGGPASGKGAMTKGENASLTNYPSARTVDDLTGEFEEFDGTPEAVLIDPDAIKMQLPEVKDALGRIKAREFVEDDMHWAAYSHTESSYLAGRIHEASLARGINVIYDGTGNGKPSSVLSKVLKARKAGYRIEANYLFLKSEEGIKRAQLRAARSHRVVPEHIIVDTYANIPEIFDAIHTGVFDKVHLFDNNVPRGEPAKIIGRSEGGAALEIKDDAAYQEFLDSGERAKAIAQENKDKARAEKEKSQKAAAAAAKKASG